MHFSDSPSFKYDSLLYNSDFPYLDKNETTIELSEIPHL